MWRFMLTVLAVGLALILFAGAIIAVAMAWVDARTARRAHKVFRTAIANAQARADFDETIAASARSLDTMRQRAIDKANPHLRALR